MPGPVLVGVRAWGRPCVSHLPPSVGVPAGKPAAAGRGRCPSASSPSRPWPWQQLSFQCLIIGAGPCGLRTAIDLSLLGAKVVVIEKRDAFSRNNVLHLWPFTIHDLRGLGAKKFYGKFCAGAIDHISECGGSVCVGGGPPCTGS